MNRSNACYAFTLLDKPAVAPSQRWYLVVWSMALLALLQADQTPAAEPENAPRRPNIVLLVADDLRYDALGFMGNRIVPTPHLDALAARGAVFSNTFCTTSICAISRASILTGQYERRHHIADFATPLSPEQFANTFPALLRQAGYRTGFVGKWGVGSDLPKAEFDYFTGNAGQGEYFPKGKENQPGEHLTAKQAAEAVEFIAGCTAEQPFLLHVSTKAPHCQDGSPRQFPADPAHMSLFADVTIPRMHTDDDAHFRALPEFLQTSEGRVRWERRNVTEELYQATMKDYYRLIVGVDDLVGRVMSQLREQNLADNTVILFTSDNGFCLGERGLVEKWFMYEESIRLPLLIVDPRLPESQAAASIPAIALNIDVAPTILDFAEIAIPDVVQGRSLRPFVRGETVDNWRGDFLYEHRFKHSRIPMSEGVRTPDWKYIRYTSVDPLFEELYDLRSDPGEERNLVKDARHAATLDTLRSRWQELSNELK